ncbi:MAG: hypothetical protein ACR2J8_10075 [Thermomicrobiales bacterium]
MIAPSTSKYVWKPATGTRSVDAMSLFEWFFVAGACSWIGTRIYLAMTHYPQIGGHGLHIAHLLWGGLLMMASLVALFGFLGRDVRFQTAVAAGIGWGLFIDELGKFITSDVNYFFKPAVALIYAIFVILFVVLHRIVQRSKVTPQGSVAQAMELWQTAELRGWRPAELANARRLLKQADPLDPLAMALTSALATVDPTTAFGESWTGRLSVKASAWYDKVSRSKGFIPVIAVMAGVMAATNILELVSEITRDPNFRPGHLDIGWFDLLKGATTFLSSALVIWGLFQLRHSRLTGFRTMKAGILVSLLLGQLLAFYTLQILALWGLALHIALFVGVNYAIWQEQEHSGTIQDQN